MTLQERIKHIHKANIMILDKGLSTPIELLDVYVQISTSLHQAKQLYLINQNEYENCMNTLKECEKELSAYENK